jgi:3-hydroxybutyryl-CoA dehydrogenase
MKLEDIKKIGVVGAGLMGHGIVLSFALWEYPTVMCDLSDEILAKAMAHIKLALDTFVEEEIVTRKQANTALGRITATPDLALLAQDADYVCEAITERSQAKKELFNKLDAMCPPHTIVTTNTSTLVLSDFGSDVKRQDKILVTHYFNPPHIVPCVEVVKGPGTSDETFNLAYGLLEKVKKLPVKVLKEIPGYLVNRIQMAMYREIYDLWDKGVASTEDIDRAVSGSFGFRLAGIGPLLTRDLAGFPRRGAHAVETQNRLYRQISNAKELPERLSKLWTTHKGFYDYPQEKWEQVTKQRDREFLRLLKQLY